MKKHASLDQGWRKQAKAGRNEQNDFIRKFRSFRLKNVPCVSPIDHLHPGQTVCRLADGSQQAAAVIEITQDLVWCGSAALCHAAKPTGVCYVLMLRN